MAEVLLTSEKFVKSVTNISDNVAGKFIQPSIREAQEINLRGILGSCLLDAVKSLVKEGKIGNEGNEKYKDLVDECQYFLAYQTIVELIPKVSYKVGNFGVAKSQDENLYIASVEELARQQFFYQAKADAHCLLLQQWIYERRANFPELSECDCNRIKANLYSAATGGVWRGGPRGKLIGRGGCCR